MLWDTNRLSDLHFQAVAEQELYSQEIKIQEDENEEILCLWKKNGRDVSYDRVGRTRIHMAAVRLTVLR